MLILEGDIKLINVYYIIINIHIIENRNKTPQNM